MIAPENGEEAMSLRGGEASVRQAARQGRRALLPLLPLLPLLAVLAVAAAVVDAGASAHEQASLPANLCSLRLSAELEALGVKSDCAALKPEPVGAGAKEHIVSWGTMGNTEGLTSYRAAGATIYTGVSAATFAQDYGLGSAMGSAIAFGEGGREEAGIGSVMLSTFIDGVGLSVSFDFKPGNGVPYAARTLALARALARQL
jgi:hypothetical protein